MAKKQKVNKRVSGEENIQLKWGLKVRELPNNIPLTEAEEVLQEDSYAKTNANIELMLNHAINGVRLAEMIIVDFAMKGETKKLFNDISKCFDRAGKLVCSSVDFEMSKLLSEGIANNYNTGILDNILASYVRMDDTQRIKLDDCIDQISNGFTPQLAKEIDADFDQLNLLAKVMNESLGIVDLEKRLDYIKSKGFSIKFTK